MEKFLELHLNQLLSSRVPEIYWETLKYKIENEIFDAGNCFMIQKIIEASDEEKEDDNEISDLKNDTDNNDNDAQWTLTMIRSDGIDPEDVNQIFLIDHCWTYRPEDAEHQLSSSPQLLQRMFTLMFPSNKISDYTDSSIPIEMVLNNMWKFNQTYSIANDNLGSESAVPIWYIMDELGCAIEHSEAANVKVVPFCYVPTMTTYSILWPLFKISCNDTIYRNYLACETGLETKIEMEKSLRLLPWVAIEMQDIYSFPKIDYFSTFNSKFTVHTSLPLSDTMPNVLDGHTISVFSDVDQVVANLKDERYHFVETLDDANIFWTKNTISDFKSFSVNFPNKYINQFPFEMLLTIKNMMAYVCRWIYTDPKTSFDQDINLGDLDNLSEIPFPWQTPIWLPTTFDLNKELQLFVYYFYARSKQNLDNYWIIKPYNLARSLDTHITNNLNQIIRLIETGPKIACKYIDTPVLLYRDDINILVKFDLRFVVLLKSIKPLQIFVHELFIVRVANKKFEMNNFSDYEQHFTVMNYKKNIQMKQISCDDFIILFNTQYPNQSWSNMLAKIRVMLRQIFEAATTFDPPKGIGQSSQSRAIYGVDVMLRWHQNKQEPVILEVNYGPDNTRLVKQFPDFYNQLFNQLFLDESSHSLIAI